MSDDIPELSDADRQLMQAMGVLAEAFEAMREFVAAAAQVIQAAFTAIIEHFQRFQFAMLLEFLRVPGGERWSSRWPLWAMPALRADWMLKLLGLSIMRDAHR